VPVVVPGNGHDWIESLGGVHDDDDDEVEEDDTEADEDDEDKADEDEDACVFCSALSGSVECSNSGVVCERMRACPGFVWAAAAAAAEFRNSGFEW
jgi:hypothetical protein